MARIKLELPEKFLFSTEVPVRIGDINYGNHLGNDAVLSLIHEARLRYLVSVGMSELYIGGLGMIITDAAIVYKSEAFYGDILIIEVGLDDFNKYGCDFFYRLTNQKTGKEVARAKTGIVFIDYKTRKVRSRPDIPPFSSGLSAEKTGKEDIS